MKTLLNWEYGISTSREIIEASSQSKHEVVTLHAIQLTWSIPKGRIPRSLEIRSVIQITMKMDENLYDDFNEYGSLKTSEPTTLTYSNLCNLLLDAEKRKTGLDGRGHLRHRFEMFRREDKETINDKILGSLKMAQDIFFKGQKKLRGANAFF